MTKVLFAATAQESLAGILEYLTGPLANPPAARALADKIEHAVGLLEKRPNLFPLCREARLNRMGCRKALLGDAYLLLYRVEGTRVIVLRFCHSRQAYWNLL